MILYVNGDSHSYGLDAGGPNFSYGKHLANNLNATFVCQAVAGCSNSHIIRTTRKYLSHTTPDLIVIGWSTWEREEWLDGNVYWQINVSGVNENWPKNIKEKYRDWISNIDWDSATKSAHDQIYSLHLDLLDLNIPHLFFNCYSDFHSEPQKNWSGNYLAPYDPNSTYWAWLTNQGFKSNLFYHFDADAHQAWANHLTKIINESIITK